MNQRTQTSKLMHLVMASVVLGGCSLEAGTPDSAEPIAESDQQLFQHGTLWPNSLVNVCVDPVDNGGTRRGEFVSKAQHILASTWSRITNLQFKGSSVTGGGQATWGTCSYDANGAGNYSTVALHFCTGSSTSNFCNQKDAFGKIYYLGNIKAPGYYSGRTDNGTETGTNAHPFGYVPFTTFNTLPSGGVIFSPGVVHMGLVGDDIQDPGGYDPWRRSFQFQVTHEFGHALGFAHDQDSPENTGQCTKSVVTTTGTTYGGIDNNSIMSYCASDPLQATDNRPLVFSGNDIKSAQKLYGARASSHGFMIVTDGNTGLAVNAWGGATPGGMLRLNKNCKPQYSDCTWTYLRGLLVSDNDPTLAIKRFQDPVTKGYYLRLAKWGLTDNPVGSQACTPQNGDCTWTYTGGEFVLDNKGSDGRKYYLNARGGSVDTYEVGVSPSCNRDNNSCMWTLPDVMLTSDRDPTLGINALNGANNLAQLVLHQDCTASNNACTFTFSRGMIHSTGNPSLAWNAHGGSVDGYPVVLNANPNCNEQNSSCMWTWSHGQILSDGSGIPINAVNGAFNLTEIHLAAACTAQNPDCVFSGFTAKP